MQIDIRGDMKKARRHLNRLQRQHIPFATALALNETATDVQAYEKIKIKQELHEPIKTTVNAIRVKRTNKRELEAKVFILPAIARFLHYQIEGGARRPRGRVRRRS